MKSIFPIREKLRRRNKRPSRIVKRAFLNAEIESISEVAQDGIAGPPDGTPCQSYDHPTMNLRSFASPPLDRHSIQSTYHHL